MMDDELMIFCFSISCLLSNSYVNVTLSCSLIHIISKCEHFNTAHTVQYNIFKPNTPRKHEQSGTG